MDSAQFFSHAIYSIARKQYSIEPSGFVVQSVSEPTLSNPSNKVDQVAAKKCHKCFQRKNQDSSYVKTRTQNKRHIISNLVPSKGSPQPYPTIFAPNPYPGHQNSAKDTILATVMHLQPEFDFFVCFQMSVTYSAAMQCRLRQQSKD